MFSTGGLGDVSYERRFLVDIKSKLKVKTLIFEMKPQFTRFYLGSKVLYIFCVDGMCGNGNGRKGAQWNLY